MKKEKRWISWLLILLLLLSSWPQMALGGTEDPGLSAQAMRLSGEIFSNQSEGGVGSIAGYGDFDLFSALTLQEAGISVGDWTYQGLSVSAKAATLTPANAKERGVLYAFHRAMGEEYSSSLLEEELWQDGLFMPENHYGNVFLLDLLSQEGWLLTRERATRAVDYVCALAVDGGTGGIDGGYGADYLLTAQSVRALHRLLPFLSTTDIEEVELYGRGMLVKEQALSWLENPDFLQEEGSIKATAFDDAWTDTGEYLRTLQVLGYAPAAVEARFLEKGLITSDGATPKTFLLTQPSMDAGNVQAKTSGLAGLLALGATLDGSAPQIYSLETDPADTDLSGLSLEEQVVMRAYVTTLNGDVTEVTQEASFTVEPTSAGQIVREPDQTLFVREDYGPGLIESVYGTWSDTLSWDDAHVLVRVEGPTYTLQPEMLLSVPRGKTYAEILSIWASVEGHVLSYDDYGMIETVDGLEPIGDAWGYGPAWMVQDWQASYEDGDALVLSGNASSQGGTLQLSLDRAVPEQELMLTVKDNAKEPVPLAEVICYEDENRTTPVVLGFTDSEGQLVFSISEKGSYVLAASKPATAEDPGLVRTKGVRLLVGEVVWVRMEAPDYTIEPGEEVVVPEAASYLDVLAAWAAKDEERTYDASSGFVNSIQGQHEAGLYWMVDPYQDVYGNGDRVLFSGNSSTRQGSISVSSNRVTEGEQVLVRILIDGQPVPDVRIQLYRQEDDLSRISPILVGYTDEQGELVLEASTSGRYALTGDKDNTASWPEPDQGLVRTLPAWLEVVPKPVEESQRILVLVEGKNKTWYEGSVSLGVRDAYGQTALGALKKTGLSMDIAGGFVSRIEDDRNEGMNGWMYEVDGVSPKVAADRYLVSAGDEVRWYYSGADDFLEEEPDALPEAGLVPDFDEVQMGQWEQREGVAWMEVGSQPVWVPFSDFGGMEALVVSGEGFRLHLRRETLSLIPEDLVLSVREVTEKERVSLQETLARQEGEMPEGTCFLMISWYRKSDLGSLVPVNDFAAPVFLSLGSVPENAQAVGIHMVLDEEDTLGYRFVPFDEEEGMILLSRFGGYAVGLFEKTNAVHMTIGDPSYVLDGVTEQMDVAPFIASDRTMVPIRFLATALRAEVSYQHEEKTVLIRLDGKEFTLLAEQAMWKEDRIFVPLSYIAHVFQTEPIWFPQNKQVYLERPVLSQ